MTYKKTYTISTETATGAVHPGTLHQEIESLNIPGFIGTRPGSADQIVIEFSSQPSGPNEALLTAAVAAHQGQYVEFNPYRASDEQDSFTNAAEYATKISITLPPNPDTELYKVQFYCECFSSPSRFRTLYRVWNATDSVAIAEAAAPRAIANSGSLAWVAVSGFGFVTPDPNNPKTIEFQFKTDNQLKRTAKIRKARLMYQLEAI